LTEEVEFENEILLSELEQIKATFDQQAASGTMAP